ncbi:MAG: hypothetical protein DMG44_10610 [Acidobacteria bacterium]|nr:MAG: hypothetical protein DMG44_10610 [Acidobacteriota bacterium]
MTKADAMRAAGYSELMVKHHSAKVCGTKLVREALFELAGKYTNKEIGTLGKARLIEQLESGRVEPRLLPQLIRTAIEIGGDIGQNAIALHLHQANPEIPPAAREMIAKRIVELQRQAENSTALLAEVIPEGFQDNAFKEKDYV